jgi:hypothetical protein
MQDSTFIGWFLPQRFSDRDGACEFGYIRGSYAVSTGNILVAGVAGTRIFVPSLVAGANNAARSNLTFLSGATPQFTLRLPLPTDPNPSTILPFNPAGYVCTLPGDNLVLDVSVDSAIISFPFFKFKV